MEFRFNEESTKNIVEGYYKKYEDFECSLEIRRSVREIKHPSRPIPPIKSIEPLFVLNGVLNVDGKGIEVSVPVSYDDVKGVFKTTLEASGYNVKNVEISYTKDEKLINNSSGFEYVAVDMSTKIKVK